MIAYMNGHFDLCKLLIKKYGINSIINQKNKVIRTISHKIPKILHQKGENVLIKAIKDRNEDFAEFLLTYPDIDLDLQAKDEVILQICNCHGMTQKHYKKG